MNLNNKGQSLVLFILIIPMLLGIMALVIDVGNALTKKNEIDNILEFILNHELDTSEVFQENKEEPFNDALTTLKDDLKILLDYNLKDTQSEIIIQEKTITITTKTYTEGIFSNILNIKGFKIESEYKGYIKDNKKTIQKIK